MATITLPANVAAEKSVLGAVLIDAEVAQIALTSLDESDFSNAEPRNRLVFRAMKNLHNSSRPIDAQTVVNELLTLHLDNIVSVEYLFDLANSMITPQNIDHYVQMVKDQSILRELLLKFGEIQDSYAKGVSDIGSFISESNADIAAICQKRVVTDMRPISEVTAEVAANLSKTTNDDRGLVGLDTGYKRLNELTHGWRNGDLIILAARPSVGKTTFGINLAYETARRTNKTVAFFSLEMSNVQLVNRLISNACEIQGSKILNGQLQPDEWDRLDKRISKLMGAPLYIDDTPGLSVFELRTKARRLVREHGVKIIMIDYLQLMNANGMRFSSRQEEVSTISRSLKGLAKELDIPILALSQLNRGVESREGLEGKRPQLSDLRESGAIEQDADMVLFVHRPEYYHIYQDDHGRDLHGMAQIIIAKHRKGATGDVLLTFRGEYTRFENPEDGMLRPKNESGGEIIGSKVNGSDLPPLDNSGFRTFDDDNPLPPAPPGGLQF